MTGSRNKVATSEAPTRRKPRRVGQPHFLKGPDGNKWASPLGRRVQKGSSGGTTNYLYDGRDIVEEVDNSGSVLARFTQSRNIDEPLAQLRSGITSYYESDGLGSVSSLTNSSGTIAGTYTYDSFGNLSASTGTLINPLRYTAREFDSDAGLYYYRARYYDPTAGRFLSEDPIGLDAGINFYAYVDNSPPSYVDPSGLQHYMPMPPKPKPLDPPGNVMDLARDLERRHFPNDRDHPENIDPYGGGYRHCVAACLLKRRWGPFGDLLVWSWDTVNEDANDQNSRDDMAAEKKGKCRARGKDSCENECLKDFPSPAPKFPGRR